MTYPFDGVQPIQQQGRRVPSLSCAHTRSTYYDNVIGGPGAFMVAATNYDTFADAILKKLITEIAGAAPNMQQSSAKSETSVR
jgi:hypothetical protein